MAAPGALVPLAMFRAARVDYSLHRLYHYTGTDPEHFQNFVIFTNYQFYADEFARICRNRMAAGAPSGDVFIEPGNLMTFNARLGSAAPIGRLRSGRLKCQPFILSSPIMAASP